jgi:hypothetical protein
MSGGLELAGSSESVEVLMSEGHVAVVDIPSSPMTSSQGRDQEVKEDGLLDGSAPNLPQGQSSMQEALGVRMRPVVKSGESALTPMAQGLKVDDRGVGLIANVGTPQRPRRGSGRKDDIALINGELDTLDKLGNLLCPGCSGLAVRFRLVKEKALVAKCESCQQHLCMGCLMKGIVGVGVYGSKNYMNAHVKTCEHIQGRGSAEWMATKRGYMRKVGESMEQGATDEDRKRRLAAFRLIDVDLVLKMVGDAPQRRSGRRLHR